MASADQILTTGPTGMSVTWPQMAAGALHGLDDVWLLLVALEQAWLLYYGEPPNYPFKSQLDSVKLRLICLCLAVRLKTAKSSQSMRLTFHGVQKYCFDYTGVTRDDVYNYMAALRGGLRTVSEEMESLAELWGDMYNFTRLLFFIGVLIVAAVICFTEKIGDRRPVRVLQRAGIYNGRLSASEKPPQSCFRCRAATC